MQLEKIAPFDWIELGSLHLKIMVKAVIQAISSVSSRIVTRNGSKDLQNQLLFCTFATPAPTDLNLLR
jgi:hypothetical protein